MIRCISAVFLLLLPALAAAQGYLPQFSNVQDAMSHCPGDTIMWVDAAKAVYRFRGAPQSVNTGGYVCRQEAIDSGYSGLVTTLTAVPVAAPTTPLPAGR
jgi:hypothetical protein